MRSDVYGQLFCCTQYDNDNFALKQIHCSLLFPLWVHLRKVHFAEVCQTSHTYRLQYDHIHTQKPLRKVSEPNLLKPVISWPHELRRRPDLKETSSLSYLYLLMRWSADVSCRVVGVFLHSWICAKKILTANLSALQETCAWEVIPLSTAGECFGKVVFPKKLFLNDSRATPELCGKWFCPRWLAVNVPYRSKFPSQRFWWSAYSVFQHKS